MQIEQIVAEIDDEISRLRRAKALLGGNRRGIAGRSTTSSNGGTRRKRRMSAEGRARIAAAQKARWAKQKREAKKTS